MATSKREERYRLGSLRGGQDNDSLSVRMKLLDARWKSVFRYADILSSKRVTDSAYLMSLL